MDISLVPKSLLEAARTAYSESRWPIYLSGNPGSGKSYSMAALFALWKGPDALWHDVSLLLRRLMQCRTSEDGSIYEPRPGGESVRMFESSYMSRIRDASLACFDDVGLRAASDAMYDAFYEICNLRKGRPTIFTGNLEPEKLTEVYDGRIASRILAGTWIEMKGHDKRLGGAKAYTV